MDTNSNIPAERKIVSVEILHLDELGYGPQGKHTRREWRKECLEAHLDGAEAFKKWQEIRLRTDVENNFFTNFAFKITFEDNEIVSYDQVNKSSCSLDYIGQKFDQSEFDGYSFYNDALFECAIFNDRCVFSNAIFNGEARFDNSRFIEMASFEGTNFIGVAFFNNVLFESGVWFRSSNFHDEAWFYNSIFKSSGYFQNANFDKITIFTNASFFYVSFEDVNFNADVYIGGVVFNNDAEFVNASFQKQSFFLNLDGTSQTIFKTLANFENATFKNIGHFEYVEFQTRIPGFRGCKIDSTRLEFSEDTQFPDNDIEVGAIENVSFLKRLSDEHGQIDQALRFNAIELRLKRLSPNTDFGFKAVTWLYEKLSDYGRSFLRPLLAYGSLIVCSLLLTLPLTDYSQDTKPVAVANRVLCVPKDKEDAAKQLQLTYGRAAFEYAMFRAGGVLDFTDTGKQNNTVNCTLFGQPIEPPFMRAWGIFKGIASIALLFLAALGLRNKYRIK
jgi:hypothetical protein